MTGVCLRVLLAALLAHTSLAAHSPPGSVPIRRGCRLTSHSAVNSRESGAPELATTAKHANALQNSVCEALLGWSIVTGTPNHESPSGAVVARTADEHELAAHLQQVLEVAERLLQNSRACNTNSDGRSSSSSGNSSSGSSGADICPAAAPELLQGGTSAFLASLLRTYPRGPTSREALAAWAAAATAFLQQHRELQRQQRQAAAEAADRAAAAGDDDDEGTQSDAEAGSGRQEDNDAGEAYGNGTGTRRTLAAAAETGTAASAGTAGGDDRSGGGGDDYDDDGGGKEVDGDGGDSDLPANLTAMQYGGLPLVRRVLLAQLLLGWMAAEPPQGDQRVSAEAVAEERLSWLVTLSRMVALLYDIHVESVAQRALMEYFHISKAGGTSWTAAAAASGCRRPRSNAARTPEFDDDCRWINGSLLLQHGIRIRRTTPMQVCSRFDLTQRQTDIRTCAGRLHHATSRRYQYVSNEYTLHGGLHDMYGTHICPQFVNVISIREPLERLVSNIKYMLVRLRATLFRKPPALERFPGIFCDAPASRWEEYAPPVADNYNIRTLVGERAFHTPLYGIGEAHEALAKQLLVQYDLVLDLNAGDAAADLLMRQGLGWNKTLAEVRIWTGDRLARKSGLDLEEDCRVGDLTPLLKRQVYDQRWYSFGRSLSRLDQLFLSAAAHMGLRPWPAEWAAEQQRHQQQHQQGASGGPSSKGPSGGARQSEQDSFGRCGLLGAAEVMRHQQLQPQPQRQRR